MQTVIIGLSAIVMAAMVLAWRWWRLSGAISGGLESLRRGSKPHLVHTAGSGPLRRLVRAFNATAADVHARLVRLERDRQELLVVLEAMAEAVIAVDPRHRLLFANAGANQLFGLDRTSVGRLVPELIRSPQVQDAVEATLRLPDHGAYRAELVLPSRDGSPWVQGQVRHLAARGSHLPGIPSPGVVLVFHDVTDLRRLERMRQDFVANASHELKTPLAAIKAYTETLLDWALHDDSVNVRFLEQIDEQAERLNQLILDLLSLARLESGQELFDHQPLDVVPVLADCVESHRGRAAAKNLELAFEAHSPDQPAMIVADEEAVRQIADNLIDNAIKYTPENGSVQVRCSFGDDSVTLDVIDTGIGIPRADLPRIFERFYRVDKARSRELGGTGLGLSIVKHLVQSIGGRIEVDSRLGSGSRFTVRFNRFHDAKRLPQESTASAEDRGDAP
jgi:two-component system phosphate regulon sensor histidine kinase PhoR